MPNPYVGNDLVELIKHHVKQGTSGLGLVAGGTITSVDPEKHMAKVLLDLTGTETGWIPIGTMMAGPGFGVMGLPVDGTHVSVIFDNGDGEHTDRYNSGKILLCDYNAVDTPPSTSLQPGEILMQSIGGASVKMDANGVLTFNGGTKSVARVGDEVQVTINGTTYTGTIQSGNSKVLA